MKSSHANARRCLPSRALYVSLMTLLVMSTGCRHLIGEATEAAVEPAVPTATTAALDELTTPENEERLNRLLALEGIEDAASLFGRGMVSGMFQAVAATGPNGMLVPGGPEDMSPWMAQLSQDLERYMTPVLVQTTLQVVEAALAQLMGPENLERTRRFAREVSLAAMEAAMQAMARALRDELGPELRVLIEEQIGPALRRVMVQEIGPGLREMLDDELNVALGRTAHAISRQVVLGSAAGIEEIEARTGEPLVPREAVEQPIGTLETIEETAQSFIWVLVAAIVMLLVLAIALGLWGRKNLARSREIEEQSELRRQTLVRLAEAIKRCEHEPWADELLDSIAEEIRDTPEGAHLRQFLRENEGLRLRRPREA